jgi:hypothetical protein
MIGWTIELGIARVQLADALMRQSIQLVGDRLGRPEANDAPFDDGIGAIVARSRTATFCLKTDLSAFLSPLRRQEIVAACASLPDIVVHARGDLLGLAIGERRPGQRLVETVKDKDLHLSLGCRLLSPVLHGSE